MQSPVLVGISQLEQRIRDPEAAREPVDLMIDAVRAAAADAECPALLEQAGSVRVIRGFWRYENPARAVCEAIGNTNAETALTSFGGNYVQAVVNRSALDIRSGRHDVIVMTGAECGYSQARARRAGLKLKWRTIDGTPDLYIGKDGEMGHPVELGLGIRRASQLYAVFETARRHHLGEGVGEHMERISELWAGFSRVAASNPHAWIRESKSAEEIRTPSSSNRAVTFPYPKFMNANNNVDQAAALILCSEEKAAALGIPRDKWIYPWSGTDGQDQYLASMRDNFYSSPAIRIAGNRALDLAGLTPDELDFVDVYSCFPVAVQVAAAELGLDTARPLTVTGGLTFAGGPLNNYVMHSVARMAQLLRESPGTRGLITANGGILSAHAFGVYSTAPPAGGFRYANPQQEIDAAAPPRAVVSRHEGAAEVEGYCVLYGKSGPEVANVALRLAGGERSWANCADVDTMSAMHTEEFCGRTATVNGNTASF